MGKFIYVFSKEDRDTLLSLGYQLMINNETASTYVFVNKNQMVFEDLKIKFAVSDSLSFYSM